MPALLVHYETITPPPPLLLPWYSRFHLYDYYMIWCTCLCSRWTQVKNEMHLCTACKSSFYLIFILRQIHIISVLYNTIPIVYFPTITFNNNTCRHFYHYTLTCSLDKQSQSWFTDNGSSNGYYTQGYNYKVNVVTMSEGRGGGKTITLASKWCCTSTSHMLW